MCGRVAQSFHSVSVAAKGLGVSNANLSAAASRPLPPSSSSSAADDTVTASTNEALDKEELPVDNYNMSPGMDAVVIWKNKDGTISAGRKVWGLVPRGGTAASPVPLGMGKHFSNLMFNARSDTLYDKPTFARLASQGKSCLVAVDGFFEWRQEGKGNKQPYFVYRKTAGASGDKPYLLMAGLWTSVSTGRKSEPPLETFTILTTEACEPLTWLHSRMPVVIWDEQLAAKWLDEPAAKVHRQLEKGARETPKNYLDWHAVTKDMTSMKFRSADSMKALPKMKTVKSFFAPAAKNQKSANGSLKETSSPASAKRESVSSPPGSSAKKVKLSSPSRKSTIDSFFAKKSPS